jgi:hypothetical protein
MGGVMSDKLYYYVNAYWDSARKAQIVHKPIVVAIENWYGSQAVVRLPTGKLLLVDYFQLWSQGESLAFYELEENYKKYYGEDAVYL